MGLLFFMLQNGMLGVGLAADAFTVSLANGLNEPEMKRSKMRRISGVFAGFQAWMPLLGWGFVHLAAHWFRWFSRALPWISLCLLVLIGGKMLLDGTVKKEMEEKECELQGNTLLLQGIATSIDALSVGFTLAHYDFVTALVAVTIIAAVTFALCFAGIEIGKKFGTRLAGKAQIVGGSILILIGAEIFLRSIL